MNDKTIQIGKYQIKIDRNLCIGAATCIAISPNVFELDTENKAIFKENATGTEENVLMAAQSCPVKAVIVIDTTTGLQVWPI